MQQSKLPVVLYVVPASTVIKIFNILKVRVKVVLQGNTHQQKVLQVVPVVMIALQASIQQQQQITLMKQSALNVLQTRTVRNKEEILHATAVSMGQPQRKV